MLAESRCRGFRGPADVRGVLPRAAGTDGASIGALGQRASVRHSCGFYLQMGLKKPVCVCRGAAAGLVQAPGRPPGRRSCLIPLVHPAAEIVT